MSKTLKFGVIGAGYMGKAYAIALNTVASVYSLSGQAGAGTDCHQLGGRRGEEG